VVNGKRYAHVPSQSSEALTKGKLINNVENRIKRKINDKLLFIIFYTIAVTNAWIAGVKAKPTTIIMKTVNNFFFFSLNSVSIFK
jgi:hypothetical protein